MLQAPSFLEPFRCFSPASPKVAGCGASPGVAMSSCRTAWTLPSLGEGSQSELVFQATTTKTVLKNCFKEQVDDGEDGEPPQAGFQ